MTTTHRACIALICIFLPSFFCEAQMISNPARVLPPVFTGFWNTKSLFNPAATGVENTYQAAITGRRQWAGYKDSPFNLGLTLGMKSDVLHGGIGVDYSFTKIGQTLYDHEFKVNYSYHVKLTNDQILSAGISGGMALMKYNFTFADPIIEDKGHTSYYDFQFGLFYRSNHLQLGLSSNHFRYNENETEKSTLNHIYLYSSYGFDITDKIELRPELLVLWPEFKTDDLTLSSGLIATFKKTFRAGFTYRSNNSYGFTAGVNIAGKLQLGYLFEYTTNRPGEVIGNHEFQASFAM
jgi:type IX secretion system PorP/SprF family membrane protein